MKNPRLSTKFQQKYTFKLQKKKIYCKYWETDTNNTNEHQEHPNQDKAINRYNDLGEPRYGKSNFNTKHKHYPPKQGYLKILDCNPHPLTRSFLVLNLGTIIIS